MPQILNANDLPSGDVVYWTGSAWAADIRAAALVSDASDADAISKAAVAARQVLDPYLVDVTLERGYPWPVRPREQIRAAGPSVRADLARPLGA